MAIYTALLACVALGSISLFALADTGNFKDVQDLGLAAGGVVFLGAVASSWIFNIFLSQRWRR
jgi:hypothetical protein